tara:strand:- start:45 stop:4583 length:4539 start_codon:yes stop_codon:yes gene_type:complete
MGKFSDQYNSSNLSIGDVAISEAVNNQNKPKGSFSSYYNSTTEDKVSEIVGTNNVIPIARNADDSLKVTFDNIYDNNSLAEVSKDFYYFRDQKQFKDNKEAINYYINDRTWKQANVVSIGKEFSYITGKDVKKDQLQRYAYLTKTWDDLPNMFQEGGGSAGQRTLRFGKNLFYAIMDPINILGVGIGGQVAKQSVKAASKKALEVAIKKAIKGKTKSQAAKIQKDMLNKSVSKLLIGEEAVKIAEGEGFKAGSKGIAATASVDSLALGGADVARQYTEMEVNPEQKFDPVRTGTVAIATFGLSGTAQFVLAGAGTLFKQGFISKSKFSNIYKGEEAGVKSGTNKIIKTKQEPGKPLKIREGITGVAGHNKLQNTLSFLRTNMFDAYDPIITLQRDLTGVGGSVKDVRKAFEVGMKKSPMLLPYFQFRMTAASNARASGFLQHGIFQPPSKNAKVASFTKDASEGLITILKKLEADNEVSSFLDYGASIRMRKILADAKYKELKTLQSRLAKAKLKPKKNATQIKTVNTLIAKVNRGELRTQVPFDINRINKSIDFGKLTPSQFYAKYKSELGTTTKEQYIKSKDSRKQNFLLSQKDLKKYTDSLLKYSEGSDMIGIKEVAAMLKANPESFIPFTRTKPAKGLWQRLIKSSPTEVDKSKITGVKSPIKDLSKKNLEGELDFLQNLISYTHRTVTAADLNRAKVSLYEMLEAAHASKLHGSVVANTTAKGKGATDGIIRVVQPGDRVEFLKTTLENLDAALDTQGLKIVRKKDYGAALKKNKDGTYVKPKEAKAMIKIMEDRLKNDQTDILTFSNQIRKTDGGNYIDIVYRKNSKGEVKAEMYEILDSNLHQMYKSFDIKAAKHLSRAAVMLEPLTIAGEAVGTITRPVARILGRFITYTPTFQLKNLVRDTQAAAITSAFSIGTKDGVGFLPAWTTGKGLYDGIVSTDAYRVSYINGLGFATRTETEGQLDSSINKLIKDNKLNSFYSNQMRKLFGTSGKRGWIRKGADAYVDFVSKVEYASRLGEFQLAKKAGFDDLGASFAGREVTTDFGMRGSSSILNSMSRNVMFLNASMQGMYRGGRVLVEGTAKDRAKAGAVLMAVVVAPEVYSYYLNKDNKEYQALPEHVKQLNHVIPFGFKELDARGNPIPRDFFTLPKPYDFGIFGNIFHALLKGIDENSTTVGAKYLAQSISLLIPVNFIGPVPMVNTAMEPLIELLLNKDAFTNQGIRKYYDQLKINDLRIKGGTKEISMQVANLSKFIAASVIPGSDDKVINGIDPITIDFLLNAYAVGILSYGVDLIELGANTLGANEKFGDRPTKRPDKVNLFQKGLKGPKSIFNNVFTVKTPLKSTKYYQIYNELKKEAKAKSILNFKNLSVEEGSRVFIEIESNARKRVDQGKSPYPKEMLLWERVNASTLKVADKKLKELNKHINNIPFLPLESQASASGMSEADYKRQEIDKALLARNQLLEITINGLADMDVEYVFENIIGGKTYVSPSQRDKQSTFLKRILGL